LVVNPWYLFTRVQRSTENNNYIQCTIEDCTSEPSFILNNIWLGSAYNAADYEWLKENEITTVINVTNEISNFYENEFVYHNFPTDDTMEGSLREAFDPFCSALHNARGNVLVHCYAGRSRSVALLVYYFITRYKMEMTDAIRFISVQRPQININTEFLCQIEEHLH
jgi:protein tyrosine phosphatase